jgi:hypothetical protein
MVNFKKLENICAGVIIVAFFLPWLSIGGFMSFSGYDLPGLANLANEFGAAMSDGEGSSSGANWLYVVYLVPLMAVGILLAEYLGHNNKSICIASGAFNIIGFIVAVSKAEGEVGMFGIGLWITTLASIVIILSATGVIKYKMQS